MVQLRERSSGILAKGETRRGERCFASVALEESHPDVLLKRSYLKA
jgi:hypothetical protein